MGQMFAVLKKKNDDDQCMDVATRNGKTIIERPIPRTDPNEEETIPDLREVVDFGDPVDRNRVYRDFPFLVRYVYYRYGTGSDQ
ncbi:hypothetical protein HAX54_037979, partial [Datura stramonium]|nr:hypothetical protein [Datura stramonium]